jgi:hypothetical protein
MKSPPPTDKRPWGITHRLPGWRNPNWDGVPVPKTPGKAKHRKLRQKQFLAEGERQAAMFAQTLVDYAEGKEPLPLTTAALRAKG